MAVITIVHHWFTMLKSLDYSERHKQYLTLQIVFGLAKSIFVKYIIIFQWSAIWMFDQIKEVGYSTQPIFSNHKEEY